MSDPRRLLEEGSDLEIAVLGSAHDDAAPKQLHKRLHVALGLGGAIVGAGTATTATTTAAAATSAAKGAGLLASIGVAKWVSVAAIGGVAAVGAATYVEIRHVQTTALRSHAPTAADSPSRSTATGSRGGTGSLPHAEAPVVVPTTTASAIGASPIAPAAEPATTPSAVENSAATTAAVASAAPTPSVPSVAGVAGTSTASVPKSPDLAIELAPLDAAHAALDAGDTALALSELDRHDRAFPRGRLAPEALALRIEAYAKRQDDAKVLELARTFLSRYPAHPQARRVQSFVSTIRAKEKL
jgi:hypothetical protein